MNYKSNNFSEEQIIYIMRQLGVENFFENDEYFQFPTICHNIDINNAKYKLYYYKENKLFHCYTDCASSFNIYQLVEKVKAIRKIDAQSLLNIHLILSGVINFAREQENYVYQSVIKKPNKKEYSYKIYEDIMPLFTDFYPKEWENDGISEKTMKKFNIKYSISNNKIIIPHYNINNELIGIRGRTLNVDEQGAKYMPIYHENILYKHPLSLNLYGLNINKEEIKQKKYVLIFESEKSVMQCDTYGIYNAVAVCGSSINKYQLSLLRDLDISEIIVCFDKENTPDGKYFDKLYNMCKKYSNLYNISFVYDFKNLLNQKDSPSDRGKDILYKLLKKRIGVK